jgi:uncharacterized protein (TIGR02246 family)
MTSTKATSVLADKHSSVQHVLDGLYAAWANNDADAFAAFFTEDATSVLPGAYRKSKEEVHANMAAGFAGPLKGSSILDEVQSIRILDDTTAVAISKTGVLLAGETEVPASRWVMATWVLSREGGEWLVAAYHNSPINPS